MKSKWMPAVSMLGDFPAQDRAGDDISAETTYPRKTLEETSRRQHLRWCITGYARRLAFSRRPYSNRRAYPLLYRCKIVSLPCLCWRNRTLPALMYPHLIWADVSAPYLRWRIRTRVIHLDIKFGNFTQDMFFPLPGPKSSLTDPMQQTVLSFINSFID